MTSDAPSALSRENAGRRGSRASCAWRRPESLSAQSRANTCRLSENQLAGDPPAPFLRSTTAPSIKRETPVVLSHTASCSAPFRSALNIRLRPLWDQRAELADNPGGERSTTSRVPIRSTRNRNFWVCLSTHWYASHLPSGERSYA